MICRFARRSGAPEEAGLDNRFQTWLHDQRLPRYSGGSGIEADAFFIGAQEEPVRSSLLLAGLHERRD